MENKMLENMLPSRTKKLSLDVIVIALSLLVLFILGFNSAEISWERIIRGIVNIGNFFTRAFPPDFAKTGLIVVRMFETLQMAVVGTFFGVIISIPIALLGANNTTSSKTVSSLVRGMIIVSRTIPDLVFALIFVISVGLGPFAGILTIMIDTVGFCGRFFMERIEELDNGPIAALESTGASRFGVIAGSVMPMTFPSIVGTSLFALEKSIRGASVLGLVGAGGIGIELNNAMNLRQFDAAFMIILVILVVVLVFESIARNIRSKLI